PTFGQSGSSPVKDVYISRIPRPTSPPYIVVSDISFSDRSGNRNQLLDAEENAEIKFVLSNSGKGKAYQLIVRLNENQRIDGLSYEKTVRVGDLAPGESTTVNIPIRGTMELKTGRAEFDIS